MTKLVQLSRRTFLHRGLLGGAALASPLGAFAGSAFARPAGTVSRLAEGAPSATAQGAAVLRALHQVIDYPRILEDPLAVPIVGSEGARALQPTADRVSRGLRAFVAMRSRYTEDRLAAAVARGVRQYVALGAGLDTFAYRNPHSGRGLRVFEVDHPATQRWKLARLQAAGVSIPPALTFVPVDFETQTLPDQLQRAGFRFEDPAFFSMLGVVVYLTESAVMQTMRFVSAGAPGSEIVFEFALPESRLSEAARSSRARLLARMAELGEPWLTFFEPEALVEKLRAAGFNGVDMLQPEDANLAYFSGRIDSLRVSSSGSGYVAAARV